MTTRSDFGKSTKALNNTKKPVDMGTLNHNNMAKSLLPKKMSASVRLVKSTKTPPVRSYPGEVHLPVKRVDPELDMMGDTIPALSTTGKVELSKEELMHASDFLKIDQSKLPLDMFDSLEHQDLDKSPQEWVATGSGAYTPFYHLGEWIWREVKVFGFLENIGEYDIQYLPSGIRKSVSRLNLRFEMEDKEAFEERRQIAINARNEAKQIMRFDHFVNQQSKDFVRPIRQQNLKKIHGLVISGLPRDIPLPEQGSPLGNLLQQLTSELILWYLHVMKNTVLQAKLTNKVYFDPEVDERFSQLKLPPYPPKKTGPTDRKSRVSGVCIYGSQSAYR